MASSDPAGRIKVGDRITIMPRGKRSIYTAEFHHQGKHCRMSLKTKNQKIAIQRALKLEAKILDGEFSSRPKVVPISQAVSDYLDCKTAENRARKTLVKYRYELEAFSTFAVQQGVRTLQMLSAALFDKYQANRKDSREKTRYTGAIIVKGLIKWCIARDLLNKDPFRACILRKPPLPPKTVPNLEQVNLILSKAKGQRQIELATLAFTGMRSGEMQMLPLKGLDWSGNWISIENREDWTVKTRRGRKIPIHARLRRFLEGLPKRDRSFLFCAPASTKYPAGDHMVSPKKLCEYFQRLAKSVGLPTGRMNHGVVLHSLRDFFETYCVNAGVPQRVVDAWMGHTGDRSMASVYYRLGDNESQEFMAKVPF